MSAKQDVKRSHADTMQVMRQALGKSERRVLPYRCAVTGRRFYAVFERAPDAETFTVSAVEKEGGAQERDLAGAAAADARKEYRVEDFDMSGRACPWCGHMEFSINCNKCREAVCGGRTWRTESGQLAFRCHDECRNTGVLVDARHVYGHEGPQRKSLPGPGRLRLPHLGKAGRA